MQEEGNVRYDITKQLQKTKNVDNPCAYGTQLSTGSSLPSNLS